MAAPTLRRASALSSVRSMKVIELVTPCRSISACRRVALSALTVDPFGFQNLRIEAEQSSNP